MESRMRKRMGKGKARWMLLVHQRQSQKKTSKMRWRDDDRELGKQKLSVSTNVTRQ